MYEISSSFYSDCGFVQVDTNGDFDPGVLLSAQTITSETTSTTTTTHITKVSEQTDLSECAGAFLQKLLPLLPVVLPSVLISSPPLQ